MSSSSRLPLCLSLVLLGAPASAQEPHAELQTQKLSDGLYLITGPGGNIALMVGKDGVFLVDDQVAPLTAELKKSIAAVTPKPVRFVLNTHWHGDHTGGNAALGSDGAVIVAHDNVRRRMSVGRVMPPPDRSVPPAPQSALPVVTFADSLSFHVNGDDVDVTHVAPAHTDGDSQVYFHKANVIHTGDTYVSGGYPFIDLQSGGTIDGFVRAADRVLAMALPTTRIIPGHGPLSDRAKLKVWRDMLVTIRDRIQKLIGEGRSLEVVQAARPTAEFDAAWGAQFIRGPQLVEAIFHDLTRKR